MSEVVERVIKQSGGVGALSKALGISPQAVHKWRDAGIPIERVIELEALSGVPREELRPDLYRQGLATNSPSRVARRKRA